MDIERLKYLIDRYQENKATAAEQQELDFWYSSFNDEPTLTSTLSRDDLKKKEAQLLKGINKKIHSSKLLIYSFTAAAVLIIAFTAGMYFFNTGQDLNSKALDAVNNLEINDIPPGENKAVLTLADGSTITLDDLEEGSSLEEQGVSIKKNENGLLTYTIENHSLNEDVKTNTISTPRGGQYQVVLPDGSRVILNAASSLTYPTKFTSDNRTVELKGEAYFEVAKQQSESKSLAPFIVNTKGQEIKVLGTHFNVNAYEDENVIKTTLAEGSIQVMASTNESRSSHTNTKNQYASKKSIKLSPGEQSLLANKELRVRKADLETELAWKNGEFIFKNENIKSVMRKLSRWYDVDIEYQGDFSSVDFGGTVSRSKNISEVLRVLELTGAVNFKIIQDDSPSRGRRIIVMP